MLVTGLINNITCRDSNLRSALVLWGTIKPDAKMYVLYNRCRQMVRGGMPLSIVQFKVPKPNIAHTKKGKLNPF